MFKEGEVEKTAGFNDFAVSRGLANNMFNASSASRFSKLGGVGKRFQDNFKGPEVILFEYDAEEQRDVDAVKIVAKKYSKLFKYLFSKYANSGYSVKAFRDFEELNKKLQTITIAEIMKMLRDHYVTNRIISKTKVSEIVRQVQPNSTPMPLNYNVFVEFFIQLGYVIYTSPPNNMTHLSPADALLKLIAFFEESARSKGHSTLLYEDPDATSMGDKKVLDELNRRIMVNPNYSLPEGYTKTVEKDFHYEYKLPEYYNIPESYEISLMVLDSLFEKLFDFHFIEPMVKYKEIIKVRPTFKKQFQQQREPLQYMKKPERRNKLDPISHPRANSRKNSRTTTDTDTQIELSTALKIEVGRYPFDKRPQVQKCAEILEEILNAVSAGRTSIKSRQPPAFRINKIEKQKLDEEQQEQKDLKKKEERRKKREREVKEKVKRLKEQRDKEQQERMQQLEEAEKAELERRKEEQKRKKREKEKKRKMLEEQRKQKEEELAQVQAEQDQHDKKKQLEQKKKNKEFLKKQNQLHKQQFEKEKQDREEFEKRQVELEEKEKLKQQKMKQEMEGYLLKNKDTRKLELRERKEIQKFYNSKPVQDLMQLYDEQLLQLYKYYTLQGNMSIGGNLEKRMNVIEFNNWVKLGFNTNMTPHLISSDDMVAIYRTLEREMESAFANDAKDEEINYIEYEHFKKGLIRITILAKTQGIENEVKQRQRKRKNTKKEQELGK